MQEIARYGMKAFDVSVWCIAAAVWIVGLWHVGQYARRTIVPDPRPTFEDTMAEMEAEKATDQKRIEECWARGGRPVTVARAFFSMCLEPERK